MHYLRSHFGLIDHRFMPVRLAMVNVVFLLPSLGMASLLQTHFGGLVLLAGVLVEGMLFLAYYTVLWWLRVRWTSEVMKRIFAVAGTSSS